MKTASRDFILTCIEDLEARARFLREKISTSDRELHFFKAELKALEYALVLMRHELEIRISIEARIRDRKIQNAN